MGLEKLGRHKPLRQIAVGSDHVETLKNKVISCQLELLRLAKRTDSFIDRTSMENMVMELGPISDFMAKLQKLR